MARDLKAGCRRIFGGSRDDAADDGKKRGDRLKMEGSDEWWQTAGKRGERRARHR